MNTRAVRLGQRCALSHAHARHATPRRTVCARAAATSDVGQLRRLSDAQLEQAVKESRTELIKLEMKKASRQEFKAHEMRAYKKKVAQLLTVKREREIEQGISKKESRKAEK
mmetsp:Transcript_8367/g.15480  ORF Transcript_8367/g.15480 Transcript_8367/m.15480 type:complete len:112 (+) Transcript_8367:119-454(+)